MPFDNSGQLHGGQAVAFPHVKATNGGITQSAPTNIVLPGGGTYKVDFVATLAGPGQLQLVLDGAADVTSVFGEGAAGMIAGTATVTTPGPGPSVLNVQNPNGNDPILLALSAGGFHPVAARLVITRLL
jgi:hypothetical protein